MDVEVAEQKRLSTVAEPCTSGVSKRAVAHT